MKHTKYLFGVLCLVVSLQQNAQSKKYNLSTSTQIGYEDLKNGFKNVPDESRLRCYWWWLNSMATKESITRDLEEMRAKGYGGASIVDAGSSSYKVAKKTEAGPVFMSEGWMELYKHAVREAERLGIELSVNVQSGWNPGAPSITPEFAMKKITFSEKTIKGAQQVNIKLPQPDFHLIYKDIMVQAIKNHEGPIGNEAISSWGKKAFYERMGWSGIYPLHILREEYKDRNIESIAFDEIIDLSDYVKDGRLKWDAPPGEWTIIRYGQTCTGAETSTSSDGWSGLSLDHLSPDAFDLFSETVIKPLITTAQDAGNSVRFLQTDSWEMGVVNWTDRFPQEFKRLRGYDMTKYMPVLAGRVVESREVSNRFLHDFRKTVGDCIAENHYQLFYDLAHEYGLGIHPESGGPHSAPVDALKVMGISDFPQGEFWARSNTHRVSDAQRLAVKQSACVAHTNGKRFVAAEGPTSIGPQWERSPKDLKGNLDRIFCSGVNRIVWHTFTSSPIEFGKPGNEYFAGTHLNPNVTWWEQAGDFIGYLNRCSFMLQQGLFAADVLYYYGDDVPNFVFLKDEYRELQFGYNWDKCSKDILLEKAQAKDGLLVLPDGMSYRLLVLPDESSIDLGVLKKVEWLVNDGLTVIGPRPLKSTGLTGFPNSDKEIQELADKMWGSIDGEEITSNTYGKGKVIWGQGVNTVLKEMKVFPDLKFRSPSKETQLDFIHRTTDDMEIYFVVNRFSRKGINDFEYRYFTDLPNRYEQVECKFRVEGKVPQIWNPETGEISDIITYKEEDGYTIIPLHFNPEESKFIVFRELTDRPHITSIQKDNTVLFPSNEQKAGEYPHIIINTDNGDCYASIYTDGEYQFTWSDGTKNNLKGTEEPERLIEGEWEVYFDPKMGGPGQVSFNHLESWTESKAVGIRYYSGAAVYTKNFSLSKKELKGKVILDLGKVQEMASITINGNVMGTEWTAPFRVDITDHVNIGENVMEVEVVNMWPNRLILDGRLREEDRLTQTNITKFQSKEAEQYLRESGLLGPVNLRFVEVKKIR